MACESRHRLAMGMLPAWTLAILVFLLPIRYGSLRAQEIERAGSSSQHLGIHFAGGLASYREDLIVPLGFNGPGLSLGSTYTRQGEEGLIRALFSFSAGYLKNRYSHEAYVIRFELHPSWVRKLTQHYRFGDLWGGVSLPIQMNNLFLESWDDAHLYWLTTYSLAPAIEWQKQISQRDKAVVRMEVPLVGLVSRPPAYRHNKQDALSHWTYHFTEPHRSLHLETPETYRGLFVRIGLTHEMGHSLLNLGWEFQYHYCRRPQDIRAMNTSITISYQWRIGP
jgi:hypothetical protein